MKKNLRSAILAVAAVAVTLNFVPILQPQAKATSTAQVSTYPAVECFKSLFNHTSPCVKGASTTNNSTAAVCAQQARAHLQEALTYIDEAYQDAIAELVSNAEKREAKKALGYVKNFAKSYFKIEELTCKRLASGSSSGGVDELRLAQVRQIASALELYYDSMSGYPTSLQSLVPTYLTELPTPPSKTSTNCKSTDIPYKYTYVSSSSYYLSFCLNKTTSGLSAGKHTLTPYGIQ